MENTVFIDDSSGRGTTYMPILGSDRPDDDLGQSLYNDSKNAVHMGKDAARTAKRLRNAMDKAHTVKAAGGAAAKAAGGQAAGSAMAAKTAAGTAAKAAGAVAGGASGGSAVAVIGCILLAFVFITFLYALPNAVFEPVQGVFETWEEVHAADVDAGNELMNVVRFVSGTVSDVVNGIFDAVSNIWSNLWRDPTENNYASEYDMTIVAQEAAERLSIVKKAVSVNDKYLMRAKQVQSAVSDQYDAVTTYLKDKFTRQEHIDREWRDPVVDYEIVSMGTDKDSAPLSSTSVVRNLENVVKDIDSVTSMEELETKKAGFMNILNNGFPSVTLGGQSNMEAVSLLYLSSAQLGGSVQSMKLSDFMKYLGYTGSGTTSFNIGHIPYGSSGGTPDAPIYGSVPAWRGTFKPQYLMEEQKYYQNEMLLAKCNGDDARADALKDTIQDYKTEGMPLIDLLVELDYPQLNFRALSIVETRSWTTEPSRNQSIEHREYTYENPSGKSGKLILHEWDVYTYTPIGVFVDYYRQFKIKYYIRPRSVNTVMDVAGLWSGDFESGGVSSIPAVNPAY